MGQHGWVEIEDRVVFDGVQQQFYEKAGYYTSESARPWYRFTRPAVLYLLRKNPTTYRWDWWLGLPWASDPANPLTIDREMAENFFASRPKV